MAHFREFPEDQGGITCMQRSNHLSNFTNVPICRMTSLCMLECSCHMLHAAEEIEINFQSSAHTAWGLN